MMTRWDWDYAWEITPGLIQGMLTTILATLLGITVAVILGLFLAIGRRSDRKWISYPLAWIIEFIRSTPLLIQLFFLFYALPLITFIPEPIRFLSPLTALVVGLGVHYACYCSEAYRAGINSVDKGQWEASTSLNLKMTTTWRSVILPQAIPRALPPLGNYFVGMFKDAPQGSAITVAGVLFVARALQSADFRTVEPYTIAGILFLIVSIPAAIFVRSLERRTFYET
ncbi:MAG: ectoine/hydroxyectoine ABC transporter permease subunit EhuD [Actinobacteria bacterium]|nr:MAG: ectoine/hydroxyectoine ABC transporter permease subunit EhuD [Actinomycetota bacterium]REK40003.1 MAG: ectoine/hydroxyectoine ABC transporter permease subunit EhuD [Actinomycetota bacterium]